mmetsp:Transcript_53636/g.143742  ORF Transcript_53636/g.143742 Transcript_53636/m.143742 type:complete len:81 (-) Transcript_53636:373-615(-)
MRAAALMAWFALASVRGVEPARGGCPRAAPATGAGHGCAGAADGAKAGKEAGGDRGRLGAKGSCAFPLVGGGNRGLQALP